MVSVFLFSKARGVRSSALPALGLAIALLILIDPFEATDPGFALSVAATAGILFLFTPLSNWLVKFVRYRKLAELFNFSRRQCDLYATYNCNFRTVLTYVLAK